MNGMVMVPPSAWVTHKAIEGVNDMEIDTSPRAVEKAASPLKVPSSSIALIPTLTGSSIHASIPTTQQANGKDVISKILPDSLGNGVNHANKDIEMVDISNGRDRAPSNADQSQMREVSPQDGTGLDGKGDTVDEEDVGDETEDETEDEDEEEDDDDDDDDEDDDEDTASSGSFQSADEVEGEASRLAAKGDGVVNAAEDMAAGSMNPANQSDSNAAAASTSTETFKKPEIPKKKRPRRRSPSYDPPQPAGPPARPTIRMKLAVAHNDEENYMTNVPDEIHKILKEKEHPWAKWYESTLPDVDTEMDGAGPSNGVNMQELGGLAKLLQKYPDKPVSSGGGGGGGGGGGRKRRKFDEYDIGQYDVRDPFVDDSELGNNEPMYIAKPSADGFYVADKEVEVEEASEDEYETQALFPSTLGKRAPIPAGFGESTEDGGGGAGAISLRMGPKPDNVAIVNVLLSRFSVRVGLLSPVAEGDDSRESYFDPQAKKQTPANSPAHEGRASFGGGAEGSRTSPIKVDDDNEGKVAPVVPAQTAKYPRRSVPRRLEKEFDMLRRKVAKESWLKKAKFPPDLREPLMQATKVAVALDEYNDNFFNHLPYIFPYNRLTLHKYTKRHFLDIHTDTMKNLIEINLEVLEKQVKEAVPILQKEFDDAKAAWASNGIENGIGDAAMTATAQDSSADVGPKPNQNETDADEAEKGEDDAANKGGEPIKRWRWSEIQREIIFTIVTIDDAIMDLRTEKITLEGSTEKLSTQNARKLIYKQIYDVWPEDGWTTTTAISREYGLYKRKVDRYTQQYHETQGRDIDSAIAL